VELGVLALEAVVLPAQPLADPRRVDEQEKRAVREQPSDRGEVQVEDALEPEAARDALVRDRRVDVAVAEHRRAALERGPDDLLDVLRPRGGVQERLRPWRHVPAVQHELADLLAELGAARLARQHDISPVGLEPVAEELRLRRLPRSVEPFEGHEHSLGNLQRP
jgi:hypothetical protein